MRKLTKNIVGVISLGVLATSWSLGQAAETGLSLGAASPQPTSADPASPTPTPTASDLPTAAPTASPTAEAPTPTSSASASATPTPTKTTEPVASGAKVTKTSAPISYVAHRGAGTMQISVTKVGSKITDITIISGGTEGGDWAAVPGILADASIKSQGANFGNVGGATHTTEAFYQALDSALAKILKTYQ